MWFSVCLLVLLALALFDRGLSDRVPGGRPEPHLQDALQPYRQKWGTTLGEYLRGPQQNLRFLMTLIYRNKQMSARIAEAILAGKSVIR